MDRSITLTEEEYEFLKATLVMKQEADLTSRQKEPYPDGLTAWNRNIRINAALQNKLLDAAKLQS